MQGEGSSPVKEPAIGDWLRLVILFVCECYGHDGSGKVGTWKRVFAAGHVEALYL